VRIADFWQLSLPAEVATDSTDGRSKLIEFLYPRMQTAKYFFRTLERLGAIQQQVLKFLAVHGGEVPVDEVTRRCYGGDAEAGRRELVDLAAKGFIFLDDSDEVREYAVLPESVRSNFELGNQLSGYLGALLQKMAFNDLAALAEKVTGDKKYWNITRERVIRRLREYLLDPENLRRHIQALPPDERILFDALVEHDGYAFYGDLLEVGGRRRFDLNRTEQLNSLIFKRGLVFQVSEGANKYANLLMVPRDILYVVAHDFSPDLRTLDELEQLAGATREFRPAVVLDNSQILLRDLVVLASYIHGQNFRVLTSGGISRVDLRRALSAMGPNKGLKYVTFLAAFLIWAKFINPVGEYWRLSDSFYEALENPGQLFGQIFNWWIEVNEWNESIPDGLVWDEEQPTHGFVGLIEMRQQVLDAIWGWSGGSSWISYLSFEELVLPKLVASASTGGRADAATRSMVRRILYTIITEPLTWLGIIALGATDKGAFSPDAAIDLEALWRKKNLKKAEVAALSFSFRPTELARGLFELGAIRPRELYHAVAPESFPLPYGADWVIAQANCEIVAPPDLRLTDLLRLCGFCDVSGVDVMTSLTVTRESLQRALDSGVRGEDVRSLLNRLSRSGLPPTVDQLIADCLEKHGEAFLGSAGGYLVADDPSVIEQIRLHGKFEDVIKDTIDNKALVLAPGANLERFARELRSLGLMPRVETGTVESSRDNRFHLSLMQEDYFELLALLRLLQAVEDQLNARIISERGVALIHRLEPDSAGLAMIHEEARRLADLYERKFDEALDALTDEIESKYKAQLSRLVAKAGGHRGPTRFHYRGQNPAYERDDVIQLLKFAVEHELEVEIQYVKRNESEATLRIYPKSFEGSRLYAYSVESDRDAMYSLDRILKATLV
jgi:hypothetical protein